MMSDSSVRCAIDAYFVALAARGESRVPCGTAYTHLPRSHVYYLEDCRRCDGCLLSVSHHNLDIGGCASARTSDERGTDQPDGLPCPLSTSDFSRRDDYTGDIEGFSDPSARRNLDRLKSEERQGGGVCMLVGTHGGVLILRGPSICLHSPRYKAGVSFLPPRYHCHATI